MLGFFLRLTAPPRGKNSNNTHQLQPRGNDKS